MMSFLSWVCAFTTEVLVAFEGGVIATLARARITAAAVCWSLPLPAPDPENEVGLPVLLPAEAFCGGATPSAGAAGCAPLGGGARFKNGLLSKIELMRCSKPDRKEPATQRKTEAKT